MNTKHEDLAARIIRDRMTGPITGLGGETYALRWLDSHPDQVPGRTITESRFNARTRLLSDYEQQAYKSGLEDAGVTIAPDPEPTNAEKINEAYDVWDRDPQNFTFGEYLDRLGWEKVND